MVTSPIGLSIGAPTATNRPGSLAINRYVPSPNQAVPCGSCGQPSSGVTNRSANSTRAASGAVEAVAVGRTVGAIVGTAVGTVVAVGTGTAVAVMAAATMPSATV